VAGADNLRVPTSEQAREYGKKGGIASGKARRKRKALNDTLNELFSMPIKDGKTNDLESIKSLASMKGKNITVQEAIVLAQIQKALKGDQRAARLLFEMLNEQLTGTTTQTESHNALIEAIRSRSNED
jgi:recombinational DNA repair protein (RecF pathway)